MTAATSPSLSSDEYEQLQSNGFSLLSQAVPQNWLPELRTIFDNNIAASALWPVPRSSSWNHAMVDLEPLVQTVCRLPALLSVVGALIGERFFLAQVEGREPRQGGGHQQLHRDLSSQRPGDNVSALIFLDDYGPHNGATRIVPTSHRVRPHEAPFDYLDESRSLQLTGRAGDILVFDADLVHGACVNPSGARRRSFLVSYFAAPLYASHLKTAQLRNVRMDTSECFEPSGARA